MGRGAAVICENKNREIGGGKEIAERTVSSDYGMDLLIAGKKKLVRMGEKRRQLRELLVSFCVYREMSNCRRGLEMAVSDQRKEWVRREGKAV